MDETDKKIRELTEAMRAEQDARIRNRMMAVRGILAGYPTKDAAYFADVDRRTVQLWVARFDEGGICGLPGRSRQGQGFHVQGTGGSGNWPTGLPARTCSPRESCETGCAGDWMPGTACAACAGSCASLGSRPRGLLPCMPRQLAPTR